MVAGAGASLYFMRKTRASKRKDALRVMIRSLYLDSSSKHFTRFGACRCQPCLVTHYLSSACPASVRLPRIINQIVDVHLPADGANGGIGPSGRGSVKRYANSP